VSRGTCSVSRARRLPSRFARVGHERGQAAVELVDMLPLLFLVAFAVTQVLVAGLAREAAHHAAQAGAMAILQDGDAVQEARAAASDWSRRRMDVTVSGRTVRVRVTPPSLLPGAGHLLASTSSASAGPS
jgi:Flp pilus assembly protein TadG